MNRVAAALSLLALALAAPTGALAWGVPPPQCTPERVGDIEAARPTVAPGAGARLLMSPEFPTIDLAATAYPEFSADPFLTPDSIILELRRRGGKLIRRWGTAGGYEAAGGSFRYPYVERSYQLGAVAIYGEFTEAPCSLVVETTFSTFRRRVSPSSMKARVLSGLRRVVRRASSVSTAGDLRGVADGFDRDLDRLASLRLRTDGATRALDAYIVYGRRFASLVRAIAARGEQFIAPGASDFRAIDIRAAELRRAGLRLRRQLDRLG